ncbi:MAG: ecdysteroid 22-kinase family protein [Spirochaetaceae bacterium]
MNSYFKDLIIKNTGASSLGEFEVIQNLWSNYGEIIRYKLIGAEFNSIVIKHIKLSESENHPRGWNTNISHDRKVTSYKVECAWYKYWSSKCDFKCRIPKCIMMDSKDGEVLIVLEDLNDSGYPIRKTNVNISEIKLCIEWLANFHGTFINTDPKELWSKGTYWHLQTRPDELKALQDKHLKKYAHIIDKKLDDAKYKTIVHGDSKLANFCFSTDSKSVAAVDFQYVGGGVGVKDLAYFIGSCLYEEDCEKYETELLDHYFKVLKGRLLEVKSTVNIEDLEFNWRELYPVAWTDFHRFLKGWSPGHWKINSYSEKLSKEVLSNL